jgi:signal peptidase I
MFFLTPRHIKQGRIYLKDAKKALAYKRDIWPADAVSDFESAMRSLEAAIKEGSRNAVESAVQGIEKLAGLHLKPVPNAALRENCEVFLVAIVVALGVRTYFLQPFTIPTGSMQPTLNGILAHPTQEPPPNRVVRLFDSLALGRTWIEAKAEVDDVIVDIREVKYLRFFTRTEILGAKSRIVVNCPKDTFTRGFKVGLQQQLKAGQVIARGYYDTGDHVFVDKMSYHFRRPARGDVFVFNTLGIPTQENLMSRMEGPSQFYIKRLTGLPGDVLQIRPPDLLINGKRASEQPIQKVMSCTNDYRGYSTGAPGMRVLATPEQTYELPPSSYFALGDNSYNSSDSRYWGTVPQKNIMGRGVLVYWPFTKHLGLIR